MRGDVLPRVYLGPSGLIVSQACLGTNMFGGTVDAGSSRSIVNEFLDWGGNFFDTADVYVDGESERLLGRAIAPFRDSVVISWKCYGVTGPEPNDRGASRRHILNTIEDSLRRIGTDYLDLVQLHRWDPTTPVGETLEVLEDLVRTGKALYVGASNYVGWQLERCLQVQSQRGYSTFVSLQSQYSLVERYLELETLDVVADRGLALLAWSPLAAGLLTGKHAQGNSPTGQFAKRSFRDASPSERDFSIVAAVEDIAAECSESAASVAIAWLCHRGPVSPGYRRKPT